MKNKVLYFSNAKQSFISTSLINVYDSTVYGKYRNPFPENLSGPDLYYVSITISGEANIILKDKKVTTVGKNDIYFGSLSSVKTMESNCEQWHAIFYWFTAQNIVLPINEKFPLLNLDIDKELKDVTDILHLLQMQIENKKQYADALFCCKLLNYLEWIDIPKLKKTELVDKMVRFIHDNIKKNIKVSDLAEKFHYSEKHIHHIFTTTLDLTPKQFINSVRMQTVSMYLLTTDLSVQEISEKLNFISVSHLINNFKNYFDTSPYKYRKEHKNILFPTTTKN